MRGSTPISRYDNITIIGTAMLAAGWAPFKIFSTYTAALRNSSTSSTGDDPGRIEPPVCRAVIGEPRNVPMADEWGVGGPDRRSSTDVDHAVGIAGNHVWRLLA